MRHKRQMLNLVEKLDLTILVVYHSTQFSNTQVGGGLCTLKDLPGIVQKQNVIGLDHKTKEDITLDLMFKYFSKFGKKYTWNESEQKILYKILAHKMREYDGE